MEYLTLFLIFCKIGVVSFGGGYSMLPMIQDEVVSRGWLTEGELMNFIGVAESTPGPIAVNLATFIGSSQAGILGALCATVGVVLPSFIIILIIASLFKTFLQNRWVQGALVGIRGVIVGLICATGLWMAVQIFFLTGENGTFGFDWRAAVIGAGLLAEIFLFRKFTGRSPSPIILILTAAALGMLLYMI